MLVIVRRVADDWFQLWVNGVLKYEDHSIPPEVFIDELNAIANVKAFYIDREEDWDKFAENEELQYIAPAPPDEQPNDGLWTTGDLFNQ